VWVHWRPTKRGDEIINLTWSAMAFFWGYGYIVISVNFLQEGNITSAQATIRRRYFSFFIVLSSVLKTKAQIGKKEG